MIIDGKKIAEEIILSLISTRAAIERPLTLGVLMGAGDAASDSYVRIKERVATRLDITLVREPVDEAATHDEVSAQLQKLIDSCDAVIVQLPMPPALNVGLLLKSIPKEKDIDALSPEPRVMAPVAAAVLEVLRQAHVSAFDKKVVVVGEGRLVGRPVAEALRAEGGEVEVVTLEKGSLRSLKDADIVVSGAGKPHFITPHMLKSGAVLIDAGTSESLKDSEKGKVVGDIDPACADIASAFTPVPGGIGPIAIAMLFKNFFTLIK